MQLSPRFTNWYVLGTANSKKSVLLNWEDKKSDSDYSPALFFITKVSPGFDARASISIHKEYPVRVQLGLMQVNHYLQNK